jgi:HPt (histidine-containing phosphotransfer) domain-containing protein
MKAVDLYAAIERLLQPQAPDMPAVEPPIDLASTLSNVDEDQDLLAEIVTVFLQDSPKQLAALREAIDSGDPLRTERTAHSLKGALGYLGAPAAHALAYELETLGRQAEFDGAVAVLQQLEHELERITAFVTAPGWQDRLCQSA